MFSLPDLPYAYDALQPVISDQTLHFHHDKHHATYVKTLNTLLEEAGKSPTTLEDVIREAASSGDKKLFNNAAQAWNHSFFWAVMSARQEQPSGELASAIDGAFGNLEGLKKAFVAEGAGHFGSGWVWLVADRKGGLQVRSTHDAEDMVTQAELTPLLVCDLWEHAYYLDHQNDRKGYLEAWFDALPHWEFAAFQYAAAQGRGETWKHPVALPAAANAQARAG
jgi:superoxide dismutase, Fe-Mn family